MPASPRPRTAVKIESLTKHERVLLFQMPANCDVCASPDSLEKTIPLPMTLTATIRNLIDIGLLAWSNLVKGWHLTDAGLRVRNNLHRRAKREAKGGA